MTMSGPPLSGLTVLIVEDEFLIAVEAQRIAEDAGAAAYLAASLAQARLVLAANRIDVVLLDLRLGTEDATPFAHDLQAGGVAVVVATGFHAGGPRDVPVVSKPYRDTDLITAIRTAAGRKS